jgi:hypothetical protein
MVGPLCYILNAKLYCYAMVFNCWKLNLAVSKYNILIITSILHHVLLIHYNVHIYPPNENIQAFGCLNEYLSFWFYYPYWIHMCMVFNCWKLNLAVSKYNIPNILVPINQVFEYSSYLGYFICLSYPRKWRLIWHRENDGHPWKLNDPSLRHSIIPDIGVSANCNIKLWCHPQVTMVLSVIQYKDHCLEIFRQ